MAQMLTHIAGDKPVTILTATSGDTGAAVAHAFYGLPNVKVVILYPRGKISPLQEKLFCTRAATSKPWRLTVISTPVRRWLSRRLTMKN